MNEPRRKFRPPIRAIVVLMLLIAVATPMVGLFFFRVFENQLIRKTEAELIAQSAALAASMKLEIRERRIPPGALGAAAPEDVQAGYKVAFSPYGASLDLASDPVLPPRPDPEPAPPVDAAYGALGDALEPVIEETRRRTLAGIQILDPRGVVLTGREVGRSLAHVEEVRDALAGRLSQRLRTRLRRKPAPWLYYLTKGASLRVFVAFPVIAEGRVAGVIYASRTPAHVMQVAWAERRSLALAAGATLAAVLVFGLIATRALTGPIHALTERTRRIAAGDRSAMAPLRYHGTREVAELSETFLRTSRRLHDRSENVAAFAAHVSHELKSPLTAIQGAAELIRESEDDMTPEMRRSFLDNIVEDSARMTLLVRRLLELARAEVAEAEQTGVSTAPAAMAEVATPLRVTVDGDADAEIAMPSEKLAAIFGNLADNAARHGAEALTINVAARAGRALIRVADDGDGVSPSNRAKLFEPFFTTCRAAGGTGMGLPIVRALVEAHDGRIALGESDGGAAFEIDLPLA